MTETTKAVTIAYSIGTLEETVNKFTPFIVGTAKRISARLPPSIVVDDLIAAGYLGVCQAHFRASDGNNFSFYAKIRSRGAIYDALREYEWLSRRNRENIDNNVQTKGEPKVISVKYFEDIPIGSYKDPVSKDETNPETRYSKRKRSDAVRELIETLEPRDASVIHLHYFREMTLKELGRFHGVTEARISQIHRRALDRMKTVLEENDVEFYLE